MVKFTEKEADLIAKCLNNQVDSFDHEDEVIAENIFVKLRR